MQPDVNVYGTTGLPKFGNYGHAIDASKNGQVLEVGAIFDSLVVAMKKATTPGNERYLWLAIGGLETAFGFCLKAIAGKPTING